jgi:hypothetical protein
MAFARLNNWSFWLLPFAASLLIISFFTPGGAPGVGWTLYAPLTVQMGIGMDLTIFAIHLLGMSSILGSINIITTILNLRAPGMTLMRMPLFVWTWLITAYLLVAAMPVLAGAVTMSLTDRISAPRSSTPRAAATRCSTSTSSGSSAPRGLHHRAARVRRDLAGDSGLLEKAPVRLRVDGVCHLRDRDPVVHGLGAPHVHGRHAGAGTAVLHVRDHDHRGADRGQGVQLGGDHVERLADLRDADAVRDRLPVPVHAGRLHRAGAVAGADRHPAAGHLLRGGALPLRDGGGRAVRGLRRVYFWLPKWTGRMYDEKLGQIISG